MTALLGRGRLDFVGNPKAKSTGKATGNGLSFANSTTHTGTWTSTPGIGFSISNTTNTNPTNVLAISVGTEIVWLVTYSGSGTTGHFLRGQEQGRGAGPAAAHTKRPWAAVPTAIDYATPLLAYSIITSGASKTIANGATSNLTFQAATVNPTSFISATGNSLEVIEAGVYFFSVFVSITHTMTAGGLWVVFITGPTQNMDAQMIVPGSTVHSTMTVGLTDSVAAAAHSTFEVSVSQPALAQVPLGRCITHVPLLIA